jgi:hypothetical protein
MYREYSIENSVESTCGRSTRHRFVAACRACTWCYIITVMVLQCTVILSNFSPPGTPPGGNSTDYTVTVMVLQSDG